MQDIDSVRHYSMSSKSEKSDKSWKFNSVVGRVRNGKKSTIEVEKREEK